MSLRNRVARTLSVMAALLMTACSRGPAADPAGSSGPADPSRGARLVDQFGCLNCHSTDGRARVGPTWKGLAGSKVQLTDGRSVLADPDYLTRAVRDPDADIVAGYPPGVMRGAMPPGEITDADIAAIVAYLESL
ncbi:MAG: c-type cytochrome [Actinomycetota bacterium]